MYYLDTNTCIYFLNGKYESVRNRILSTDPANIKIPAIVKAELLNGAYKSNQRGRVLQKLDVFMKPYQIEPFSDDMTHVYADIRSRLETAGCVIGPNDMIIAATVASKNGTLITNNEKEFSRIDGLSVENWVI